MNRFRSFFSALLLALPGLLSAQELRLGTPFSDHMVLQRDRPIPVWGWAPADREVTVRLGKATATNLVNRANLPASPFISE